VKRGWDGRAEQEGESGSIAKPWNIRVNCEGSLGRASGARGRERQYRAALEY
jgi:hypothetical protein